MKDSELEIASVLGLSHELDLLQTLDNRGVGEFLPDSFFNEPLVINRLSAAGPGISPCEAQQISTMPRTRPQSAALIHTGRDDHRHRGILSDGAGSDLT